jgi:hypothetical protein
MSIKLHKIKNSSMAENPSNLVILRSVHFRAKHVVHYNWFGRGERWVGHRPEDFTL